MARFGTPDNYSDSRPLEALAAFAPYLRRLKVLFYLTLALLVVVVLNATIPLGAWLLLSVAVAVPTLASLLLVAAD